MQGYRCFLCCCCCNGYCCSFLQQFCKAAFAAVTTASAEMYCSLGMHTGGSPPHVPLRLLWSCLLRQKQPAEEADKRTGATAAHRQSRSKTKKKNSGSFKGEISTRDVNISNYNSVLSSILNRAAMYADIDMLLSPLQTKWGSKNCNSSCSCSCRFFHRVSLAAEAAAEATSTPASTLQVAPV